VGENVHERYLSLNYQYTTQTMATQTNFSKEERKERSQKRKKERKKERKERN
jgi:hypothetical protein